MPQPNSVEERLDQGDEEYFSIGPVSASYNEVHAMQLGLLGVFAGLAYSAGLVEESLTVTGVLALTAIGVRAIPGEVRGDEIPIAVRTKRHEPWWFISSYSVTFMLGALIGSVI